MRKLKIPNIDFSDIYDDCTRRLHQPRKGNFVTIKPNVVVLKNSYVSNAKVQKLHTTPVDSGHSPLNSEDFKYLYTGKMLDKKGDARKHYDKLMLQSPNKVCPYCDFTPVNQLDHVLAKAHYSTMSITPENLVPVCGPCNFSKKDKILTVAKDLHLHPYFDDELKERWLHARVVPTIKSITFEYFVEKNDGWSDELNDRVETHFDTFDLKNRMEIIAGAEVSGLLDLVSLYKTSPKVLKAHLTKLSNDSCTFKLNFWKTAMFCALRDSDWFCNGGVMNIEPDKE